LGSRLLRNLVQRGESVIILKRSFSQTSRIEDLIHKTFCYNLDEIKLSQVFDRHAISLVLHCATDYGRKHVDPSQIIEANLTLPLSILHLLQKSGGKVFINTDTILDKNVNFYSLSKKQFLDWLQVYSKQVACINIGLEHFYGPTDDRTKFISWVISQLVEGADELKLTLGEQKRDFVYITDTVRAFELILDRAFEMQPGFFEFQVGSGELIEIRELVKLAKQLSGNQKTKLLFGALPYRKNEVMASEVRLGPLAELGWKPSVSLVEGLKEMITSERQAQEPVPSRVFGQTVQREEFF
jgi:CDP-paratose synthetase